MSLSVDPADSYRGTKRLKREDPLPRPTRSILNDWDLPIRKLAPARGTHRAFAVIASRRTIDRRAAAKAFPFLFEQLIKLSRGP
jgi:hypothetical protein